MIGIKRVPPKGLNSNALIFFNLLLDANQMFQKAHRALVGFNPVWPALFFLVFARFVFLGV